MATPRRSGNNSSAAGPGKAPAAPQAAPRRSRWRLAVPIVVVAAVVAVLATKPARDQGAAVDAPGTATALAAGAVHQSSRIPRLVDLGADKCIPCKAMAPILVELRTEYAGRMQVDFIDVWKDPSAGDPYNIRTIPTQIFFDGAGRELTRHEGFISKQDILATWKRLGVDLGRVRPPNPRS